MWEIEIVERGKGNIDQFQGLLLEHNNLFGVSAIAILFIQDEPHS